MRKLYTLLAIAFAAVAMTSCFDDPGTDTFFGGNQIEFADAKLPNGVTATFVRESETQTDITEVGLNRVSTTASSPITATIAVDPSSTAVEGVHYSLAGNTVTIGAGEFIANFPVTILTGNIDPSETPDLVLNISSATGADVASNYGKITVQIRVICPSDLAGTWQFANGNVTTITEVGTGTYRIANLNAMGGYYGQQFTLAGNFTDSCNELELFGDEPTNGVAWRGMGIYDPVAKTITFESVTDVTFNPDFSVTNVVMTRQ
ncbi:hypothetical protein [Algoriphagus namhaensis]